MLFAAVQAGIQIRTEELRESERAAERDERIDRAFQFVWAEHFRLEGLADRYEKLGLVNLASLGLLRPEDVLPRDPTNLTKACSLLGTEAGFLGGAAIGVCYDVAETIGIYLQQVNGLPPGPLNETNATRAVRIRAAYSESLGPLEKRILIGVRDLSLFFWDVVSQNSRIRLERTMVFSDDLKSDAATAIVGGIVARANAVAGQSR